MNKLILTVAAILFAQVSTAESPAAAPKAVLVTGASTGIGRNLTEHLAGRGYIVYAGARKLILKWSDLVEYNGNRAQRGGNLPRGFQRVERIETSS